MIPAGLRMVNMSIGAPPCRHCGPGPDFYSPEKIAALVKEIPIDASMAADEEVYRKRLEVCGGCGDLSEEVLCSHCGCFVLFRARGRSGYCPHPKGNKWDID